MELAYNHLYLLFQGGINKDSNISNNIETIKSIIDIFKTLAEASANIPNMGGVASFFAGDNKIGDFANEFGDTSTGIKTLIDSFKDVSIEESTKNNITFGLEIFKTLAEASKDLPKFRLFRECEFLY